MMFPPDRSRCLRSDNPRSPRTLRLMSWLLIASLGGMIAADSRAGELAESHPAGTRPAIAPADVRPHVEYLASDELEGRGTPQGKALAVNYIRGQLERLKLQPLFPGKSFEQVIPGPQTADGKPTVLGRNVGAWLPGSDPQLRDEYIILSAHYDHLGMRRGEVYPGADDNATGVAMLLEVARQMATGTERPRRSIAFVSFDLEEHLLWGSRWFVAHPPFPLAQTRLFMTADMIGRSLGDLPLQSIFVMGSEHGAGLKPLIKGIQPPTGLEVAHLGVDLVGTRSDYGPFRSEKIPFLFFSSGEHPDYHTPRDTPDRVNFGKVANVSTLVLDILRRVAGTETAPEWVNEPEHDLDDAMALQRITTLLLEQDDRAREEGRRALSDVQRFMVSNVQTRTAQMIAAGKVAKGERPWLIRSAQLLLITVF